MINAQEYEELLYKANNNSGVDIIEYLQPLLDTQDIYKKSNIEGVFIRVGRLTSRNEIVLYTPAINIDTSEPIVTYERGWWTFEKTLSDNLCNGEFKYLETKPYAVFKDTGEKIEELCTTENEYLQGGLPTNVLGYVTRLKNDNRLRDMVLYNQYLTGDEHGVAKKYGREIVIQLPNGTKTKIAK